MAWLVAVDEAMETTRDDVQDRRILALEREVARLAFGVEDLTGRLDRPADERPSGAQPREAAL